MICKTCEQLLDTYENSVRLYTNAARNIKGVVGDDFQRTLAEAERIKLAVWEANESLMTHWRQEHGKFPFREGPE